MVSALGTAATLYYRSLYRSTEATLTLLAATSEQWAAYSKQWAEQSKRAEEALKARQITEAADDRSYGTVISSDATLAAGALNSLHPNGPGVGAGPAPAVQSGTIPRIPRR